jgi:hypothetical protein
LLFVPPCGPHFTPLAIGSLERSLLVFSTPGSLTGNDLSRLFFTCTNTSQACNARKISPDKSLAKSLIKNIFKIFSAI